MFFQIFSVQIKIDSGKILERESEEGNKDITLKVKFAIELLLLFVDAVDAVVVVVVV